MVVLKIVRYTTCYEQSFSKAWHQQYLFWHKVHRGCKSHRELQKPSAAHACSSHPLNSNVHTDRLRTKTSSPYVPKEWLVPTQGRWKPAQHQLRRAQQQDRAEAPPPVPVTTAAHVLPYPGDFYLEIQGLVFKNLHLNNLILKNTSMHRLDKKKNPVCPSRLADVILVQAFKMNIGPETSKPDQDQPP